MDGKRPAGRRESVPSDLHEWVQISDDGAVAAEVVAVELGAAVADHGAGEFNVPADGGRPFNGARRRR